MSLLMNFPDLLLGLGLVAVTPAQAQAQQRSVQSDAAAMVQVAREQCSPGAGKLRSHPAAGRGGATAVARRAAEGSAGRQRLPGPTQFPVDVQGLRDARCRRAGLVQKHCATLSNPELTEVGVQRSGTSYWLVSGQLGVAHARHDGGGAAGER
jgi:hypothetical protein